MRVLVAPRPILGGLVVKLAAHPTQVGTAIEEDANLRPQPVGGHPIVVVPVHDHRATCEIAGQISLGAEDETAFESDVPDAPIGRHQIGDGIVTVIQDEQLTMSVVLAQEILDRLTDEGPAIVGWHDAGDERLARLLSVAALDDGRPDVTRCLAIQRPLSSAYPSVNRHVMVCWRCLDGLGSVGTNTGACRGAVTRRPGGEA